ncbi:MAG: hypothetical protein QXP55_05490 [Nitrososphaerales archaeon]
MKGEVKERKDKDIVAIDDKFIGNSKKTKIKISKEKHIIIEDCFSQTKRC